MKVYQEKWLTRLYNAYQTNNIKIVYAVCLDIVKDDTGGTDEIAQVLAQIIIKLLRFKKKVKSNV